ncbi:hypothetical protein RchiOBHm_Chr6g0246691 [Rosa chinensis]|uniref:Uncharacterized protein n=1 Tax=Rosa chinensis TaxID=74649 RepID=A0A2P6PJL4_ROSCH|nr:hypothetical protein RchiOBHm_Chr6g0246691 [Rosa chinensis]
METCLLEVDSMLYPLVLSFLHPPSLVPWYLGVTIQKKSDKLLSIYAIFLCYSFVQV